MAELKENLLLEEFRQAWEHYRHVENIRVSVMGFLFTVVLASGAGGSLLLRDCRSWSDGYFLTLIGAFVIGALSVAVDARLARQALVMRHYAKAWEYLRQRAYDGDYRELSSHLSVYKNTALRRFYPTEERITKLMALIVALIYALYLVLGVFSVWPDFKLACWQRAIVFVLLIVLTGFAVWVVAEDCRAKKKQAEAVNKQQ